MVRARRLGEAGGPVTEPPLGRAVIYIGVACGFIIAVHALGGYVPDAASAVLIVTAGIVGYLTRK